MEAEEITVYVGLDACKRVRFIGEWLGEHRTRRQGHVAFETLYRVSDGRLVAHIEEWVNTGRNNWLKLLDMSDLLPGGEFEALGRACGYRPTTPHDEDWALSLDKALEMGRA